MKKLIEHYESRHNPETMNSKSDNVTYSGVDSGCNAATEYLGHQSSCFKCPFRKCVLEEKGVGASGMRKRKRDEEILRRYQQGESVNELAASLGVHPRTIQRVLVIYKK